MGLSIGIVGLPNVGKSTTFNALAKEQLAQVANYPFCTIEPNRAVVPIPDGRVDRLAEVAGRLKAIHATVEFLDIAGLVEGASRGEGLGNQFLGQIRTTNALAHVVRCFDDPNVVHISQRPQPEADIGIVNLELILADLQQLERKIERLGRQVKGDRGFAQLLAMAEKLAVYLETGRPLTTFPEKNHEAFRSMNRELSFLSSKPVIYIANVDEQGLERPPSYVEAVRTVAAREGAPVVVLCARLEEALAGTPEQERRELLELAGVRESGLESVVRIGSEILGLISFFTMNEREVRAWSIPQGFKAPAAAGAIHTDFERGFIRAEVIPYQSFMDFGSTGAAKAAGAMRLEGKEYQVQDGDLIYFRFNV